MIDRVKVASLGAGSTIPDHRPPHSAYINVAGTEMLIDAPEGVQSQLFNLDLGLSLDSIVITNSAQRSLFGLPGILNTMDHFCSRNKPLDIYCPAHSHHQIRRITDWFEIDGYQLNVKETIPGEAIIEEEDYKIESINNGRSDSFGIGIYGTGTRGEFDRSKAEKLGVQPGPKFSKLCEGKSVEAKDGTIVKPEQVLGESPDPIRVVFSGRTPPSKEIKKAAQNADILVHEAIGPEKMIDKFEKNLNRSNISDAADVASESRPEKIFLSRVMNRAFPYDLDGIIEREFRGRSEAKMFSEGTKIVIKRDEIEIET